MNTLFGLFLLLCITGVSAHADSNTIKYGRNLCEVVSFRDSTQRACEDWVIDNSSNSIYSVALNVCVSYNQGPASRSSECFDQAAQWITDQLLKDQNELCSARNGNYNPRAECQRGVFVRKNKEYYQAQQATKQNQEQRSQPQSGSR